MTVLPQFEFPKNLTCPSGKFRTEFTSSYWTLLSLQSLHGDVITMLLRYMVHTAKYYTVVQNLHCKETCVKRSKKGLAARFEITVIALKQKNTTQIISIKDTSLEIFFSLAVKFRSRTCQSGLHLIPTLKQECIHSDFVTNSYGESWDSSCEKS